MDAPATAVYLRQSKDRDGNELAISRQRAECLKLCKAKDWDNIREYRDNDRSATNGKVREKYQDMLKDVEDGKIGRVVVWDLDRLHRQPIELEHFMRLADQKRLGLATVTGEVDLSTDNGRLFARIKGAVGIAEVERKAARQKAAMEQIATAADGGRPWWPHRPFGYDADPDKETGSWWTVRRIKGKPPKYNTIRKHHQEAKLVKDAYRDFLKKDTTLWAIAKRWNDAGVTTPRGNRWVPTQVRYLLLSPRNAGLRELNGKVVGKGTWLPIVTEDVWRDAVTKLSDPKRHNGAPRGRKYLLSGIAVCGREGCGARLSSAIATTGHRSYQCYHCQRIGRDGVKLDQLIIERVVWRLSREDAVELLRPKVNPVDERELRAQRRALRDRLAQLGKDFATAPPEFTRAALADIQGKLDGIDAELQDPGKAAIFEGVIGAKDVRKAFVGLDLGRQRTIVDALMTIRVMPVGKGTGRVFDPDRIDAKFKEDL